MTPFYEQIDRRFNALRPLVAATARPPRGWIRAIREALGMTTAQLARRLGVQQPRVIELERGEASGHITIQSLERAAEALGCRFVYVLIPEESLAHTIERRASATADRQLAAIDQTMRLEDQGVTDRARQKQAHRQIVDGLMLRRARLWDEP